MKLLPILALLCPSLLSLPNPNAPPGLQPWPDNAWYWSYRGQPVLLLGGSDDDNLFQWTEAKLKEQLERLVAAEGNVVRNTMSDRRDLGFEVYPFRQLDHGKYDLEQWNDEYWERFARFLSETARRQVFVQIEIWDRFDYSDHRGNRWQSHPYHPANNVNYTFAQSGFAPSYPAHPGANQQPFFRTTPAQQDNQIVLRYQQRFVNKLLDHTLRFDHVLYCIDNETRADASWGRYWAEFVKRRASQEGKQVFVTEMWDDWDLRAKRHKQTFDHPELYDFVDVSQNNHLKGQQHWDNFLYVRDYLSRHPRPMNTTKTYGADGNKFGHSDQDAIERFWRHLLAGAASIRFHRPESGLGLNDKAVACLRAARKLEALAPLWNLKPANQLLVDRQPNQAYAAADPGKTYAVYFPQGGTLRLDLAQTQSRFTAHWIQIDTGRAGPSQPIPGGAKIPLSAPNRGNWAVVLLPSPDSD